MPNGRGEDGAEKDSGPQTGHTQARRGEGDVIAKGGREEGKKCHSGEEVIVIFVWF